MHRISGKTPIERSIAAKRAYVSIVEAFGSADWTNVNWTFNLDDVDEWAREEKVGSLLEIGGVCQGVSLVCGILLMVSPDDAQSLEVEGTHAET